MNSSSEQISRFSWFVGVAIVLGTVALFMLFRVFLDGGIPVRSQPNQNLPDFSAPIELEQSELEAADGWLISKQLNPYGDPLGTMYAGGTPLFNESTGARIDRLEYLKQKFPDEPWKE